MANPFDAALKEEVINLIKSICGVFTKEYVKHYAIGLVKKAQDDAQEPEDPYKLPEREPPKDDLKAAFLVKEGGVRKNWKKRYFVVRYDYTVDYFVDDKASQKEKPKPKGTMFLSGYHVEMDLENSLLKRVEDLAQKMNVDVSQLPKPKSYPEHTIEIFHPRRRSWYIQCASAEEKKEWGEMFKVCCRKAHGFKNRDPVHVKAFHKAVRATRHHLGRWGHWSYGGSEEQILTDIITDEIDWTVMSKIYSKLTGPYMIRNTLRNTILKTLDTLVGGGVAPAWKAMSIAVEELRAKVEPQLSKLVDPVGTAKKAVVDKMIDAVAGVINPLLDEHVKPHVKKIVDILTSPVKDAYEESFKIFEEAIAKFKETADLKKLSFKELDSTSRYWVMHPATTKLDIMYDPLFALRETFSEINPWSLIWNGHDAIRKRMDNAIYAFEERLKKKLEENPDSEKEVIEEVKISVLTDYRSDGEVHKIAFYSEIIKIIVMPPLKKVLDPATKPILDPLNDAIPDVAKDYIDIGEEFDNFIDGLVDKLIEELLN